MNLIALSRLLLVQNTEEFLFSLHFGGTDTHLRVLPEVLHPQVRASAPYDAVHVEVSTRR